MSDETQAFPLPTIETVDHALRELTHAERLVGYKMTASAGNAASNMYSLGQAVLFLTGNPWDQPMLNPGFKGALNWIDLKELVSWLRDTVGDADLADAIEQQATGVEPYQAQNEVVARLVNERMMQYRAVHDAQAAEVEAEESAEAAGDEAAE